MAAPPTQTDTSKFLVAEAQLVLEQARAEKAERIKDLGDPIQLPGKPLGVQIRDGTHAWVAESTGVARKVNLETGKTAQVYKSHTGPVTCLEFYEDDKSRGEILITGSWDKTIKLWDTKTKEVISSTEAHSDFVKALFVLPTIQLLVSSGSDKVVRFWDLSTARENKPLTSVGTISVHTRPVSCIHGEALSSSTATLYTADTMGSIKVWNLSQESGTPPRWRPTLKEELGHHRTRVNELHFGNGQLWTVSSDDTLQVIPQGSTESKPAKTPCIAHPVAVRALLPLSLTPLEEPYVLTGAGDIVSVYDVSELHEPQLVGRLDAHWHDVTAIRFWARRSTGEDGRTLVEPWILTASLDGTLRKWKLADLLKPTAPLPASEAPRPQKPVEGTKLTSGLTEEEERELAELMDDDDD